MSSIKKIAISTGGGDAPGLNAVIRATVLSALNRGWKCLGIRQGYAGLLDPDQFPNGGTINLDEDAVRGITHLGGTILGTTNRGHPFAYPITNPDGTITEIDRSQELVDAFKAHNIDAVVSIGGDGSMDIAHNLSKMGVKIVGVPKTIDNDLDKTVVTFGFDTAVTFATECLDRLHATADSHNRVLVVEVMGRYAGWIALHAGLAATADVILIPEVPFTIDSVAQKINQRTSKGRHFSIVIVAEGASFKDEEMLEVEHHGGIKRLGGIGKLVSDRIAAVTGKETRSVVLGHLLRGGYPTARDRLLSLRFGAAAVRALDTGQFNCMVALDPPTVRYVPLAEATSRMKTVPLDCDTMATARDLGISFGD
ncbi:MAG TPA: ATP-dependent 6-phosphofructokinase [Anaerolineae bacterium]|nr:ATP-dependent 6-phosphofructokinase [Anaerolineae bacterium]